MNLRDLAQKFKGYIQSKTQDDKGFIQQGKFTTKPISNAYNTLKQDNLVSINTYGASNVKNIQSAKDFTTGLKSSPVYQFGQTLGQSFASPFVNKSLQQNTQQYSQNVSTALQMANKAKTQEEKQRWLNLAKQNQSLSQQGATNVQQQYNKTPLQIAGEGAGTFASVIGGAKLSPKTALTMAGITGGLSKLGGGSFAQGAGTGLVYSPVYAGIGTVTNPLLSKVVGFTPVKAKIGGRVVSGLSNVGQGIVSDISTGQKTTPLSMGIDLATGIVGGKTQFDTGVKVKGIGDGKLYQSDIDQTKKVLSALSEEKKTGIPNIELRTKASKLANDYNEGFNIMPKKDWQKLSLEEQYKWISNKLTDLSSTGEQIQMGITDQSKGVIPEVKTIKIKPSDDLQTQFEKKIKVSPNENILQSNGKVQGVDMQPQKTQLKTESIEQPKISQSSSKPIISDQPFIDKNGELQFPDTDAQFKSFIGEGRPKADDIFAKPELDTSDVGIAKGSILGGSGMKASPEVKSTFADWVNARKATQVEGIIKSREFKDLDSKGIDGIFEYQSGVKSDVNTKLKQYFDSKFEQLNKEGVDVNYKNDYLPQMWNNTKEEVSAVFGNRLSLKPSFTMDSIIKNYQEGIQAGLTPKYTKVSDLVASYEASANKAIANRKFFDSLKKDNLILPSGKAPLDWVTLDPDRFPKLNVKTDQGQYSGTYKAPDDLARMINNYLSDPSTSPNVFLKGLNSVANWTSSVKNRVLSFGVPGTAINAHGFNILARNVLASKNPIEGAITGIKYMLNPNSALKSLDAQLSKAPEAVKNGLTFSANEFKGILDEPQGFKGKFADVWNKLFEKGLFDKMLPALKLQKYQEVYEGFLKGGMDTKTAGREAVKFTNDVFGGINWEELGKSRDMQNLLRVTVLAPDWLKTNINLAKKLPMSVIRITDKTQAPYRKFLATFIGTYVTMNVVNKLSSGHWMYENDSGNTFNIEAGYTSDGQKRYIRPFGTAADFIRIPTDVLNSLMQGDLQAPARVVRNRLSLPVGVGMGILTDTDYAGQPIGYKGKDKYGAEMPTSQRVSGIAGELTTLAGVPAFTKQGFDYLSGKTGGEQALLQGFEMPFRYSGGAYTKTQQEITDILKEQGATGKELYNASKDIKGLNFSDKDIKKIKVSGIDEFNKQVKSKQNSAKIKVSLKTRGEEYQKSEDTAKGLGRIGLYGKSVITDPGQTIRAVLKGNPIRKVEGGAVILERQEGLSQLDKESKKTEVDHIIPLSLGGVNPSKKIETILKETEGMSSEELSKHLAKYNLNNLSKEEHEIKSAVGDYLLTEMKAGRITKNQAQEKIKNWKSEAEKLPESILNKLVKEVSAAEKTDNTSEPIGKTYTITDKETGDETEIDLTFPTLPETTGYTELDKDNKSKYKSALTKLKTNARKLYEDGQLTLEEYNDILTKTKSKSSTGTGKSKSKGKVTFKVTDYKMPKFNIKISAPKASKFKLKSAPKIKISKTNRRYTIKA